MVQFDNQYRQIKVKIVYYGPALGGKTTCLQFIHGTTDPDARTKLYSLNTASDRTLFFDLLSLNLGRIRGYDLAMQLYTVPGQVQYDTTRRAVLSGADGVVFVADSQRKCREANAESLENLWANMAANGLDRNIIPVVLHYNKRDLEPILTVEELDSVLNGPGFTAIPSVAVEGTGVMEGFSAIAEQTLASVADKLGVGSKPATVRRLQDQVRIALRPYLREGGAAATQPNFVVRVPAGADGGEPLTEDMLVSEAVQANLAMTDLNVRLDTVGRQLERKVTVLAGVHDFAQAVAEERDALAILRQLLTTAADLLDVPAAAVITVPRTGPMHEVAVNGVDKDPLLHIVDDVGEPLASGLTADRTPRLLARVVDEEGSRLVEAVESAGFSSAIAVPLVAQDTLVGLLTLYGHPHEPPLGEDELQLASVLAATAAMAVANARSWHEIDRLNRGLEAQVDTRTEELRLSLEDVRRLADDLEAKNTLIDEAYRELAELDRVKDELLKRLSSELRAPVSSVGTAAKILFSYKGVLPPKGNRFVEIIRTESDKLTELISSIFQASVLAGAQHAPRKEEVPLEDLFKSAVIPLRDAATARGITLKVLIPSGLETLSCERVSMETALRAVIKNAIMFNRDHGEVKVAVRRVVKDGRHWLELSVADTGPGIPKEDRAQVFETFWQGGDLKAGAPRGVGLGLAIAKTVVENHGGTIAVTSSTPDGTELTIRVPQ